MIKRSLKLRARTWFMPPGWSATRTVGGGAKRISGKSTASGFEIRLREARLGFEAWLGILSYHVWASGTGRGYCVPPFLPTV
ncbi:MAG: hypothetical protein AAFY24_14690 [Pseudomonadota bacterium]